MEFDETTHTYTDNGKTLISVTQLLAKHGLAPSYDNVNEDVVRMKAERGTFIHQEIANYIQNGKLGISKELASFRRYCKANNITFHKSEYMVHNDIVAGTCDFTYIKDGELYRVDFKTTSQRHYESVGRQLSLYDYLDTEKANHLQAWYFDSNGKLKVVDIPFQENTEIERLLECERTNQKFVKAEIVLTNQQLEDISKLEQIIENAKLSTEYANAQLKEIQEAILKQMEEKNIRMFKNDRFTISYVSPTTRVGIDTKRLKEERPDIAEEYKTETQVKASVRIKLKGEK